MGAALLVAAHFGWLKPLVWGFYRALSHAFMWARRRRVQSEVSDRLNAFLSKVVFPRIADADAPDVGIEFVQTATDAAHELTDGKVIVRMRQDRNQDLNLLMALSTAVTQIFHPHIRGWLAPTTQAAIDLQIVSELASSISDRARKLFHQHVLEPRLVSDPNLRALVPTIHEIAEAGLFETVLLQELSQLSDRHVMRPPKDLAADVDAFIEWLHYFATREPGDEGQLDFLYPNIKAAALLAAKTATALRGTDPYTRRARSNFFRGARDLYLLGLTTGHADFVDEIADAIAKDAWGKIAKVVDVDKRTPGREQSLRLVLFRRDEVRMSGKTFAEFVRSEGVEVGRIVTGVVSDINQSDGYVLVRVGEVDVEVPTGELEWGFHGDPAWIITPNAAVSVQITDLHEGKCIAVGSIKRLRPSPWGSAREPKRHDRLRAEVVGSRRGRITVRLIGERQSDTVAYGTVPESDWTWYDPSDEHYIAPEPGVVTKLRVTAGNVASDEILLSRATTESRDWNVVNRRYPDGTRSRAKVIRVDHDGVRCEMEEGVYGRVDRPELQAAGFEYADHQDTMVPGQMIDVVVIGRRQNREFLKLALRRTVDR